MPLAPAEFESAVREALEAVPFIDIHTHLFPPAFGGLSLWGIDDLLTYHYLEAELFRFGGVAPEQYWLLDKPARADIVWRTLFIENTPLSEAARGVIAVLHALGLGTSSSSLGPAREFFKEQTAAQYFSRIFHASDVDAVVMTNDPLDPNEMRFWNAGVGEAPGFYAALRLDRILNEWDAHWPILNGMGYPVHARLDSAACEELRRFLRDAARRIHPLYMAVSLPDSFEYPADDARTRIVRDVVLPSCLELDLPLALMIGVRRGVNPRLRSGGDASGRADLTVLERLCGAFPENRFLVSVLSRENQHELCVYARKFSNLLPFGCWWFLNNPSIVDEITRERLEMLGTTFIPQHSDARVLEQLLYKWRSTRRTVAPVLAAAYRLLSEDGRPVTRAHVRNDVGRLFRTNFERWVRRPLDAAGRGARR